jgi:hypothetical protein
MKAWPGTSKPMIGSFPACCALELHIDRDQQTAAPDDASRAVR